MSKLPLIALGLTFTVFLLAEPLGWRGTKPKITTDVKGQQHNGQKEGTLVGRFHQLTPEDQELREVLGVSDTVSGFKDTDSLKLNVEGISSDWLENSFYVTMELIGSAGQVKPLLTTKTVTLTETDGYESPKEGGLTLLGKDLNDFLTRYGHHSKLRVSVYQDAMSDKLLAQYLFQIKPPTQKDINRIVDGFIADSPANKKPENQFTSFFSSTPKGEISREVRGLWQATSPEFTERIVTRLVPHYKSFTRVVDPIIKKKTFSTDDFHRLELLIEATAEDKARTEVQELIVRANQVLQASVSPDVHLSFSREK